MELCNRQQQSQRPVISCTEGNVLDNDVNSAQNVAASNAECKDSVRFVFTNTDSHSNIVTDKQQLVSSATSLQQKITEDSITEVAEEGERQPCSSTTVPSDGIRSLASVDIYTDKKQLAVEVVDSVSCMNTDTEPHRNAVKLGHACLEGVHSDDENNDISEHCYRAVCEDDLSAFFGSPVSVSSLSTKLKAIPRRKAKATIKCEVKADCLHSNDHAFVYNEHELDNTVNCMKLSQQCLLPLHDVLTRNIDKPLVCTYVTTSEQSINENSGVGQSSSIRLSLAITDTGQYHLPADLNGIVSSISQSSACPLLSSSQAVMSPSNISPVVPLQDQRSSCLGSVYSAVELPIGLSVSLLDKWSGNDTSTRVMSKSSGSQMSCCEGYSKKPLQKLVKHSGTNNPRFLYPSAAQVYCSPVNDVFKRSSDDKNLFPEKRSRSLLYQTPYVLQFESLTTYSKAEEHMNKTASLDMVNNESSCNVKERIVEDHDVHAESVLTSQSENRLLTASNFVSSGLNRIAVTSCGDTVCNIGGMNKGTACDDIPECTVMETYCYGAKKMLSENVSTDSAASLPSSVDSFCGSRLMRDFAGQTSPGISSRTAFCDVGVQTDLRRLATEFGSNVSKQPLLVNAAVQTLSQCTCNKFSQLHKRHSFNSQTSNLPDMNELWHSCDLHNTDCVKNATHVNCISVGSSENESAVENCYSTSLLSCAGIKVVNVSNQKVTATNTTCISTTVNYGNRCTITINQGALPLDADVHHVVEAPQFTVSNNSSVNCFSGEVLSSAEAGKLLCTNIDSVGMVTADCALVMNDVSLNSTNVFPDSFATGFISAGGKRLSVKLSSKVTACKLLDELVCTEADNLDNATDTAHSSNTDFPTCSGYSARKVGQDLFQNTISGLIGCCNDNVSDCSASDASVICSSKGRNQQLKNWHDHTVCAYPLNWTNMSNESNCDHDVFGRSSASLTIMSEFKSANTKMINACVATHQLPSSSSKQCFVNTVPDMTLATAKQFAGKVNADDSVLNCGLMKFHSKSMISNGLKPFKTPRSSMQSSKHGKKSLPTEDGECLRGTNVAQSHSLKSEDKVKSGGESELLCDLTNTQLTEVVDASLIMLNSAELFAVPCSDDVNDLAAEQLVSHNNATVNMLAPGIDDECVSYCNIPTDNDNVPRCSPVCLMPSANSERICENSLTGHMQHVYSKADTAETVNLNDRSLHVMYSSLVHSDGGIHRETMEPGKVCNIDHNTASCITTACGSVVSVQEDDLRDAAVSYDMPSALDSGHAETKPVSMVCLQSGQAGATDTSQGAGCKICSCTNDNALCNCACANQKASQSSDKISANSVGKDKVKYPCDAHISAFLGDGCCSGNTSGMVIGVNNKAVEVDKDNSTHKSSPFVFFSARGSQINVTEKTLRSVREKWNKHLNGANSIGAESNEIVKGADVNKQSTNLHSPQDTVLQTTAEDMYASSVASDNGVTVEELITNGSCNRNTLLSVSAVDMHPADVQSTSVTCSKVLGPNVKSVQIVSDDADISNGCVTHASADKTSVSSVNTSIHAAYIKPAEHTQTFIPGNLCSDTEADGHICHTNRDVLVPLRTVPESKSYALCFFMFCMPLLCDTMQSTMI